MQNYFPIQPPKEHGKCAISETYQGKNLLLSELYCLLKKSNRLFLFIGFFLVFTALFLLSIRFGTMAISGFDFFDALFNPQPGKIACTLIWEIRIPRFLAAILCGGSLALCGQLLQLLVRNPLAEPYTLGTGSGAALGMQLAVLGFLPSTLTSPFFLPIWAFAGAFLSGIGVLIISGNGKREGSNRLLLAGVAISILAGSAISFLNLFFSEGRELKQMAFWSFGSLDGASWARLIPVAILLIPCIFIAMIGHRSWNQMLLGDEKAASLGQSPERIRLILLLLSSFITACVVSLAGPIGFIGLVVPYCTRQVIPLGQNGQFGLTLLSGSLFLAFCDLLPRLLFLDVPVPAGLISSLTGLPLFLYLLRKSGQNSV